jgi:hypothetical protein
MQPSGNIEGIEFDPVKRREEWLRRLADEFVKLESSMPVKDFLPESDGPAWVANLEREVGAAMFPVAKLKKDLVLTPRRLGAIIGHQCGIAVWMMEWVVAELSKPQIVADAKITPEQINQGKEFIIKLHEDWYSALRRLAKRALSSSVDQSYEDMRDFLSAYAGGFARKPADFTCAGFGSSTFGIYVFMLWHWQAVEKLKSVRELHEMLVKHFDSHRVGELTRTEKICQRIGLHYRKPGRPKGKINSDT